MRIEFLHRRADVRADHIPDEGEPVGRAGDAVQLGPAQLRAPEPLGSTSPASPP